MNNLVKKVLVGVSSMFLLTGCTVNTYTENAFFDDSYLESREIKDMPKVPGETLYYRALLGHIVYSHGATLEQYSEYSHQVFNYLKGKNFKHFGTISNPKLFTYVYKPAESLEACSWNSGYLYYIFFTNAEVVKDEETGKERYDGSYYLLGLHPNQSEEIKWSNDKDAPEEAKASFRVEYKLQFHALTVHPSL